MLHEITLSPDTIENTFLAEISNRMPSSKAEAVKTLIGQFTDALLQLVLNESDDGQNEPL